MLYNVTIGSDMPVAMSSYQQIQNPPECIGGHQK